MIYESIAAIALAATPNEDKLRALSEACASLKLAWKAGIIIDYRVSGHTKDGLPFSCIAEAPNEPHDNTNRPIQNGKKDSK